MIIKLKSYFKKFRADVFFISLIFFILIINAPTAYQNYKIRKRVESGLTRAQEAKNIVERNIKTGSTYNIEWTFSKNNSDLENLLIDTNTGIITIIFANDIDGGGKTLKLFPVFIVNGNSILSYKLKWQDLSKENQEIFWTCASANITVSTKNSEIIAAKGTLSGQYSPSYCR